MQIYMALNIYYMTFIYSADDEMRCIIVNTNIVKILVLMLNIDGSNKDKSFLIHLYEGSSFSNYTDSPCPPLTCEASFVATFCRKMPQVFCYVALLIVKFYLALDSREKRYIRVPRIIEGGGIYIFPHVFTFLIYIKVKMGFM